MSSLTPRFPLLTTSSCTQSSWPFPSLPPSTSTTAANYLLLPRVLTSVSESNRLSVLVNLARAGQSTNGCHWVTFAQPAVTKTESQSYRGCGQASFLRNLWAWYVDCSSSCSRCQLSCCSCLSCQLSWCLHCSHGSLYQGRQGSS